MRRALFRWAAIAIIGVAPTLVTAQPFRPQVVDAQPMLDALASATPVDVAGATVTGLALPHHRVAAHLIASGMLTAAQGAQPERIVILTPDHFKRSTRAFATTRRDFDTALGPVPTDRAAAQALLGSADVAESVLFEREHGIGELLPYVARLFPGIPVLPVAVRISSTRPQWDRLVERLAAWITPRTLIIQSTDFSHYLPRVQAVRRDQQMLNVLAAGDLDALAAAGQPEHLDSRGAQYIQMRLQARVFGAQPIVFGNRNSADDGATSAASTTSYIAQVYAPAAFDRVVPPLGPAQTLCLAGDTFFGRHVARWLLDAARRERVAAALGQRLRGCALVLNLEGVLSADGHAAHDMQLAMRADETLRWLRELNVVAASVANNHSHDLGDKGYDAALAWLRAAGVTVLEHGRPQHVGPLRITAFSELDNSPAPRRELIAAGELQRKPAPDLAFLHWGREYVVEPAARERQLAAWLQQAGVPIVVGAHPHRASRAIELLGGLDAVQLHSLGNFVFDQHGAHVSGAVLQISVFAQGTHALRLIPLPDVFELGR